MEHEAERRIGGAVSQPLKGIIGYDVGHVTGVMDLRSLSDHGRIMILALPGQNIPVVETRRLTFEMPFPYHRCIITIFP